MIKNIVTKWFEVNGWFTVISKFIFISLSCYYLVAKDTFSISIFDFLKYTPLCSIWEFFSKLNLLLIIIPMTIVIISLTKISNKFIEIIARFFTIGGLLLSIINFTKFLNIGESLRLGLITVTNETSLMKKEILFKEQLKMKLINYAETAKDTRDFLNFIDSELKQSWESFVDIIKTKKLNQINEFSEQMASKIHMKYLAQLQFNEQFITTNTVEKGFFAYIDWFFVFQITLVVGSICAGGYYFWSKLRDTSLTSKVITMSEIQNEESKIKMQTKTEIKDVNNQSGELCQIAKNDYEQFALLKESVTNLDTRLTSVTSHLDNLSRELRKANITPLKFEEVQKQVSELASTCTDFSNSITMEIVSNKKEFDIYKQKLKDLENQMNNLMSVNQLKKICSETKLPQTGNITQSSLAADAAEKRLIDFAQNLLNEFTKMKTTSEDTLNEFKKKSKDIEEKMEKLESFQESMKGTSKVLEKKSRNLDEKTKHLDEKTKNLDENLAVSSNLFMKHEDQLTALEDIIDRNSKKLVGLEIGEEDNSGRIAQLQARLQKVEKFMQSMLDQ